MKGWANKFTAAALSGVLALSLTACSDKGSAKQGAGEKTAGGKKAVKWMKWW